ncbi:MAG: hypothetical protein ACRD2C_05315 [Acidimicrobiales bacterium]
MKRPSAWLALVAACALGTAACGDDTTADSAQSSDAADVSDASTVSDGDFCAAALAFEAAPEPEIDFESADPEEISEGISAFATETLVPLAEDLAATAPDEVSEAADAVVATVEEVAVTGDFAPFEDPGFNDLADQGQEFAREECGWTTHTVRAVDYGFEGLPEELAAGVVTFELVNEGHEMHEMALFRKNDGVTASAEELLALPEAEVEEQVTFVTQVLAEPGDTEVTTAELAAGDYVAVCFVPVGLTSEETEPAEDAPPHFSQGMVSEFTVS